VKGSTTVSTNFISSTHEDMTTLANKHYQCLKYTDDWIISSSHTDTFDTIKWCFSTLCSTHHRQHITFTFIVLSSVHFGLESERILLEPWI
jgi:hypothetical protein